MFDGSALFAKVLESVAAHMCFILRLRKALGGGAVFFVCFGRSLMESLVFH